MEYVILILILFIFINIIIKLSFWKWWQAAIFGAICGVFILLAYPYAITQSKTQLVDYLNNADIMKNIAVLITIESVIYLGFCFYEMRQLYGVNKKRRGKLLFWYSGLLIFPVLFYVLAMSIFYFSGVSFSRIAYIFAGILLVFLPLLSVFVKKFLSEKELRLEVQFLVSIFVAITGLICTVNGNVTYAVVKEPLNITALLVALGIFFLFFAIGFIWNKIKWKFKKKKIN